jgi:hypothetical protein
VTSKVGSGKAGDSALTHWGIGRGVEASTITCPLPIAFEVDTISLINLSPWKRDWRNAFTLVEEIDAVKLLTTLLVSLQPALWRRRRRACNDNLLSYQHLDPIVSSSASVI